MQRYYAALAVLALANDEGGLSPIHIAHFQMQGLRDPQAGTSQEADQSLEGIGAKSTRELTGASQNVSDLPRGVEVRGMATEGWPEEVPWRQLRPRLGEPKVLGKKANHR